MIQISVYAVVTGIAAAILGYLALYVWKRRSTPGGLYFSLMMLACAHWALLSAIGILVDDLYAKVLCLQILFAGNAWVPSLLFFFALSYSRSPLLKSRYIHLLWLEPAAVVVLELTNQWHGLIWSSLSLTPTIFGDTLIREHGILGWLNAVYTYALILAAFGLIIWSAYGWLKKNRVRGYLIVLGALIGLLGNVVSFLGVGLWGYLDMAPLVFPVMGILFAWAIFDQHMFDLVPVARDTFVRSMGHGLLVLDEEGSLADINPAARRMLGVKTKQELMSVDVVLAKWPQLADCWQSPKETSAELRLENNGGLRWVDARSSFLYDGKGSYQGRVIALWDITRRKQDEESLKEAKTRSDLYLDLMSHDILNMNMVGMGFLEQALYSSDSEAKKIEYLQKSMGSLENSTRLIQNVEKMQMASSPEFKLYEVDACRTLGQVQAHYSGMPGINITMKCDIPADCKVIANDLLYDVFANIVGNAIKHGGPELSVAIRAEQASIEGRQFFRFVFEDNGRGIPDYLKVGVFNRLQRGDTVASGRGLGLHLVKTLVGNYNGRVWVEDRVTGEPAQGSRFIVELPAAVQ